MYHAIRRGLISELDFEICITANVARLASWFPPQGCLLVVIESTENLAQIQKNGARFGTNSVVLWFAFVRPLLSDVSGYYCRHPFFDMRFDIRRRAIFRMLLGVTKSVEYMVFQFCS